MHWLKGIEYYHIAYINNDISPEGQNERNFLIICNPKDLSEEHKQLLENILKAIQYSLHSDCHLLTIENVPGTALNILKKRHNYRKVLLFGIPFDRIGLNMHIDKYVWYRVGQLEVMRSDSLSKLHANKSLKASLWNALKPMADNSRKN